jgi:hypothetical protein
LLTDPSRNSTKSERPGVQLAPGSKVAVINLSKFHHEVYPAFHYAFLRAGYKVKTYALGWEEKNIPDGLKDWAFKIENKQAPDVHDICGFDLVVFTSIEYREDVDFCFRLMKLGCVSNFILVVHNTKHVLVGPLKHLIRDDLNVELYTLAPHTAFEVKAILSGKVYPGIKVSYLVPLFPFRCNSTATTKRNVLNREVAKEDSNLTDFTIQGTLNQAKRSYSELFLDVAKYHSELPPHFHLSILGRGAKLRVPENIAQSIDIIRNECYCAYYGHIMRSVALLTAFASNVYFTMKASSTVAASLITQVPLLTEMKTLQVYNYLSPDSVWLKRPGNSDVQAMLSVLSEPDLERKIKEKKESLLRDIARVHAHNLRAITASMASFGQRTTRRHRSVHATAKGPDFYPEAKAKEHRI